MTDGSPTCLALDGGEGTSYFRDWNEWSPYIVRLSTSPALGGRSTSVADFGLRHSRLVFLKLRTCSKN